MQISNFRKKISCQLSKDINFEILFRNLEHVYLVKFSGRNFAYGAL